MSHPHYHVLRAVRLGVLPNLKKEFKKCADCSRRALEYDHRDYSKPLMVEAVCRSCNAKRGAVKNRFNVPYNVNISDQLHKRLKIQAAKSEKGMQELVELAIREYLTSKK